MQRRNWMPGLLAIGAATGMFAALAALVSCGGGSSGSLSGTATPSGASGIVTGFGSVIVNGTEFATSAATQVVDGDNDDAASSTSNLQVGMAVDLDADMGSATFLRFTSAVRGRIDAIDPTGTTITVLGQTVQITSATSFSGSKTVSGTTTQVTQASNLSVGDYVVVFGYLECAAGGCASGSTDIVATLVYEPATAGRYRVQGYVENFNAGAGSFTIGGLTVDIVSTGAAPTACVPAGCGFSNGDFVAVRATTAPAGIAGSTTTPLTLTATDIRRKADVPTFAAGASVTIEGPVRQLSPTGFVLRGIAVDASAPALAATLAGLVANQVVEVTGTIGASGTLVASAITVERYATFALMGPLDATPATTFSVLGQTFSVGAGTRFVDWAHGARPFNSTNFASVLKAGDQLIVSGYPDNAAGAANVATRVERIATPASPIAAVQAVVSADSASADTVTAAGITVSVGASTRLFYPGAMGSPTLAGFFTAITPNATVVAALGAPGATAGTIPAADAALMGPGARWSH
jgi:hypothetical protein